MDNQGRQVLFIVLSIVILFSWMYFMPAPPPETANAPVTQGAVSESSAPQPESSSLPREKTGKTPKPQRQTADLPAKEVTIETDDYIATFSTRGALLTGFQLKKYLNRQTKKFSQLVNPDPDRPKPFSVNFPPMADLNQKTFEVDGVSRKLSPSDSQAKLRFRYVDENGTMLEKTFGFKNGSYLLDFEVAVSQTGKGSIPTSNLSVEWADTLGAEENTGGTQSRTGGYRVTTWTGDHASSESTKKSKESVDIPAPVGWTALADQFFVAALIPDASTGGASAKILRNDNAYLSPTEENPNPGVNPKVFTPRPLLVYSSQSLRSGESFKRSGQVFIGPQDYTILKSQKLQLENVINFGMFGFISVYMLELLKWFYSWAHNWGLAIIFLSIAVKLLLWWPTHNSYKNMAQTQGKMKEIQPKLDAIKRKYADDKQEQQKQTMAIYQSAGINPMGGCLPMLLQMPIFFALYATLQYCIELRGASFLWLGDLTLKDPTHVFPLLMGASMVVQQRVSGQMANQAAGQQKVMMWMLPIMLTYFSFQWPGGLLVYWVVTNILSMIQQKVVNREIQKAKKKDEVAST